MTHSAASRTRFLVVATLLAATALFLQSRGRAENLPHRELVASFPAQVGDWHGRDEIIQPEIREILGSGEFLARLYSRTPQEPPVDLFVAYFASQRTGDTLHSPKNCLPGAGWSPVDAGHAELTQPDGARFSVNRYVIAKGPEKQVVLYWYQAHGRGVASEYWAKFYLVADAIRMNRTDGALVRLVTPLGRGESVEDGQRRAVSFAQRIIPLLDRYIPR